MKINALLPVIMNIHSNDSDYILISLYFLRIFKIRITDFLKHGIQFIARDFFVFKAFQNQAVKEGLISSR